MLINNLAILRLYTTFGSPQLSIPAGPSCNLHEGRGSFLSLAAVQSCMQAKISLTSQPYSFKWDSYVVYLKVHGFWMVSEWCFTPNFPSNPFWVHGWFPPYIKPRLSRSSAIKTTLNTEPTWMVSCCSLEMIRVWGKKCYSGKWSFSHTRQTWYDS